MTTWLKPPTSTDAPLHTRIHRITTSRRLSTCEGGFAIAPTTSDGRRQHDVIDTVADHPDQHGRYNGPHSSYISSEAGMSGLIGIYGKREGKVLDVDSNSNLMAPRTLLPTLQGVVEPGTTWYAALVFGVPHGLGKESQWARRWQEHSRMTITSVHDLLDDQEVL